jgi:hypothetical protein
MPELINIATGRQARPPELDKFATAFAIVGEKREMVADQKTMIFLKRFSDNSTPFPGGPPRSWPANVEVRNQEKSTRSEKKTA